MKFKCYHNNYNVFDLEKSLSFYKKALGLVEVRRRVADDESFTIVFLGDETTDFLIELTWLRDRDTPYDLGEGEYHLAFIADDYDAAKAKHKEMGCICFENEKMGIYFIEDPDGYWLEVVPDRSKQAAAS
jgi:lactoylglutathione lyase